MRPIVGILMASAVVTLLVGAGTASAAVCGNGVKEAPEECDSTDFCCNPDCTKKPAGTDCDDNPYDCNPKRCTTGGVCDAHPHELDGDACVAPGGGDACHQGSCSNGSCVGTTTDPCTLSPSTACKLCTLHPENGPPPTSAYACDGGNRTNGTACNGDTLACTLDSCTDGTCVVGPQRSCPPTGNECTQNLCDEPSGSCVEHNKTNGTPCTDDFFVCTKDICRAGVCRHEDPDGDLNGTPCNDGNPCTKTDQCSYGSCSVHLLVGTNTPCSYPSQPCWTSGTCNSSGICIVNFKSPGTACDDGNACTNGTTCNAFGSCTSGTLVATGTACDNSDCTSAGTCSATGQCQGTSPNNVGGPCYNRDFCNPGVCASNGTCTRGSTQTSGTCQDFNSCTDPATTVCNEAGLCVQTCFTDPANHICDPCQTACGSNPNQTSSGSPVPCSCVSVY